MKRLIVSCSRLIYITMAIYLRSFVYDWDQIGVILQYNIFFVNSLSILSSFLRVHGIPYDVP